MHVRAAQPAQLAAAQPGTGHQQHRQPIPRRATGPQQRDDLPVTGPVHRRLRLGQPMPGAQPPGQTALLAAGLLRQVARVCHLEQQRHQPSRGLPQRHCMGDEPAHRGQHPVDPTSSPRRRRARPGQHLPTFGDLGTAGPTVGVPQPCDEQAELLHPGRQRHRERPHPDLPSHGRLLHNYQPRAPQPGRCVAERRRVAALRTSHDTRGTP